MHFAHHHHDRHVVTDLGRDVHAQLIGSSTLDRAADSLLRDERIVRVGDHAHRQAAFSPVGALTDGRVDDRIARPDRCVDRIGRQREAIRVAQRRGDDNEHRDDHDKAEFTEAERNYDAVVADIRAMPGFDSFLGRSTFHDIAEASSAAQPLVYLVSTPAGTVSLLVEPSGAGGADGDGASGGGVTAIYSDGTSSEVIALLTPLGPETPGILTSQFTDQDMAAALDAATYVSYSREEAPRAPRFVWISTTPLAPRLP